MFAPLLTVQHVKLPKQPHANFSGRRFNENYACCEIANEIDAVLMALSVWSLQEDLMTDLMKSMPLNLEKMCAFPEQLRQQVLRLVFTR